RTQHILQHRHQRLSAGWKGPRCAARQRRHGDVPRQEGRPQRLARVCCGHEERAWRLDMKTLEQQMGFYAAYHQDARSKATHFVGVPAIMLSLFIPLAWLRIELGAAPITAAMLFAAAVLVYYFMLDVPLGLAMLVVSAL